LGGGSRCNAPTSWVARGPDAGSAGPDCPPPAQGSHLLAQTCPMQAPPATAPQPLQLCPAGVGGIRRGLRGRCVWGGVQVARAASSGPSKKVERRLPSQGLCSRSAPPDSLRNREKGRRRVPHQLTLSTCIASSSCGTVNPGRPRFRIPAFSAAIFCSGGHTQGAAWAQRSRWPCLQSHLPTPSSAAPPRLTHPLPHFTDA